MKMQQCGQLRQQQRGSNMLKVLTKQELVFNAWIEALKSGKYKQITKRLGDKEGGYCAMGLLYHISYENGMSPALIMDYFVPKGGYQTIVDLNDSGVSFEEIANIVVEEINHA
jgi:hypothetical protein